MIYQSYSLDASSSIDCTSILSTSILSLPSDSIKLLTVLPPVHGDFTDDGDGAGDESGEL